MAKVEVAEKGLLFIIKRESGEYPDHYDERTVQTDWEWPALATAMGWQPCSCGGGTDGTVDCKQCGRAVSTMMEEAYDWICEHEGEEFAALDEFFEA